MNNTQLKHKDASKLYEKIVLQVYFIKEYL